MQCKCSRDGPAGIVVACSGEPEHRHDLVADELIHDSPVRLDDLGSFLLDRAHDVGNRLRVEALAHGGEARKVRDQDGHHPSFSVEQGDRIDP